ncbi:MAG: DUF4160 domain-containing protein [Planctomycetaceae bacterium]
MPTVLREGPYRFYFFSHEPNERPHVHVSREHFVAKFWIDPVSLAANHGFADHELRRIERMVRTHRDELIRVWQEWFDEQSG